ALHALGRDGPDLGSEVELVEPCSYHLASAQRGQNCDLKSAHGDALLVSQASHEGGHVFVGQSGVMLGGSDLASLRQYLGEMTAPECWVFAGSPPANLGV